MNKRSLVTVLKYAFGIALLAWVIWRYWDSTENGPGLAEAWREHQLSVAPLLLAMLAYCVGLLLTFYRWFVLVRAQEMPFTMSGAVRLGLIGFYLSTFLPGSIGGDIVKAAIIAKEQRRRTVAVATVIVDRFIGLCGLFWLVAAIGGATWLTGAMSHVAKDAEAAKHLEMIVLLALVLTAVSFAVWFAAGFVSDTHAGAFASRLERIPKLGRSLAELWRALHMYRRRGRSVALAVMLSMIGHVGFVLAFYFAAQTLSPIDQIPSLAAHFLLIPVGMTIEAGVPSPGGVGGGEITFGALYKLAGFTVAAGVLGSLVRRVITWILGFIGYLVYLRMKPTLPSEIGLSETAPHAPTDSTHGPVGSTTSL